MGLLATLVTGCDEPHRSLPTFDASTAPSDTSRDDLTAEPTTPDVASDSAVAPDATIVDADAATDAADAARDVDDGSREERPEAAVDATISPDDAPRSSDVGAASPADITDVTDSGAATVGAMGTPIIDGVIGGDWPAGSRAGTNTAPSPWDPALNALRSLRIAWDGQRLYVGIEGTVEARNGIVVYLDRDYVPGGTATGVIHINELTDATGALDDALSAAITTLPDSFGVDLAWGSLGMQRKAATELRADVGLRDLSCPRCAADFGWVMGDEVACAAGACEIALAWTSLYGASGLPPSPRIGLFVRLVNGTGATVAAGQCLPPQGEVATTARAVATIVPTR